MTTLMVCLGALLALGAMGYLAACAAAQRWLTLGQWWGARSNLRCKWVGRWSSEERQLRLFRVMWESFGRGPDPVARYSHKVSVSIKHWLPWITVRRTAGGIYV